MGEYYLQYLLSVSTQFSFTTDFTKTSKNLKTNDLTFVHIFSPLSKRWTNEENLLKRLGRFAYK